MSAVPTRPVLRWHGGKWKLAPWILSYFPEHRVYVEPFGGAASVLLRKPRSYGEVYNDLDGDVVCLFRVLQSQPQELERLLRHTPFARAEHELASEPATEPVDIARRLVIRAFMGFGSNGHNVKRRTGFRSNSNQSGTTPAHDWANYPDCLAGIVERLRGVVIESRDALQVMLTHDEPDTLHYLDPPYLPETRSNLAHCPQTYTHEMTTDEHLALLERIQFLQGMIVLSGYPSPLYEAALETWTRIEIAAHADGARDRTEVLWLNPQCAKRLNQGSLKFN